MQRQKPTCIEFAGNRKIREEPDGCYKTSRVDKIGNVSVPQEGSGEKGKKGEEFFKAHTVGRGEE